MENKYSLHVQKEIVYFLEKIHTWENLFFIQIDHYVDGWSISLHEKNAYPRKIIIFKSYDKNLYSIRSFEIHNNVGQKEGYEELYSLENIENPETIMNELKEIIYGKDILSSAKKTFDEKVY